VEGLGSEEQDWETRGLCRVCAEVEWGEVEGGRVLAGRANPSYKAYRVAGMFSSSHT